MIDSFWITQTIDLHVPPVGSNTQKIRVPRSLIVTSYGKGLLGEHTRVVYITYTMATRDLPDKYARACGP